MATIHISQIEAVRLQDVVGLDEAAIFLAGREAIVVPMSRGQVREFNPHLSETFGDSIVVGPYQAIQELADGDEVRIVTGAAADN